MLHTKERAGIYKEAVTQIGELILVKVVQAIEITLCMHVQAIYFISLITVHY